MPLQVKTTGAAEYGRWIKTLIVGEPGSGKTLTASTWPNPLWADSDGGLMSIAHLGLPFVEITSLEDMKELRSTLDQKPEALEETFGRPIETLVIDTFDAWQDILIKERLAQTKKESFVIQDWGWLTEKCKAIVNGFRNLQMNVVFLVHIKDDGEDEHRTRRPALSGGIKDAITGYFDLAMVLRAGLVSKIVDNKTEKIMERVLVTYPDARHPWVKDRSGKLPREFPVNFDDDYARIRELIFSGIESLPEATSREVSAPRRPQVVDDPVTQALAAQDMEKRAAAARGRSHVQNPPTTAVSEPPANIDPETGEVLGEQTEPDAGSNSAQEADTSFTAEEAGAGEVVCDECGGPVTESEATMCKIKRLPPLDRECMRKRNGQS